MYRERPSAAWLIIPPLILGSIYNVVQTYVITEVYTSSSNRGRIVVVLAFQPVVAQLLLKLAEVCSHFMVKWIPSLADHAFYFPWAALQMLTSMIGRVYLSNLSSLGDQLLSALLLMLIEVSIRITRPLRTYIMWRGLCLSHEDAMHKARASHLGLTHRHTEYLGQFGQICSIVIATVFSVVVRAQYGISQPAGVIIGSVLVQLVVAFLGDFLSIIVQCWYLGMNLGFWYRHQKSGLYLRTFLYTVPLAALFVKDAMQIVLSTSDYTHEG